MPGPQGSSVGGRLILVRSSGRPFLRTTPLDGSMSAYAPVKRSFFELNKGGWTPKDREPRIGTNLNCAMIRSGTPPVQEEVILENIGTRGFGIRCFSTPAIGSSIVLEMPDIGSVTAVVRWAFCGRAGGVFRDQIDPSVLAKAAIAWTAQKGFDF